MSMVWFRQVIQTHIDAPTPVTVEEVLKNHALFEQSCLEQAKAELEFTANSGLDFCCRLLARAQEIKAERKAAK